MRDSKVVRNTEYCEISFWVVTRRLCTIKAGFANRQAYHIFVIENRDASEERALPDQCGSYLTEHVVILDSCSWGTNKN